MPTRREVLQWGLAGMAGLAAGCAGETQPAAAEALPQRPNLLLLITDQERHPRHWPPGLREQLMPSWQRLEAHGIAYNRAYCAASQCSPSRAVMLTGRYGQLPFLEFPDPVLPGQAQLPNLGTLMQQAGYEMAYKGKWHLSFPVSFLGGPPSNETWTGEDVALLESKYGMPGWNPPDAGNNAFNQGDALLTLGGGNANNDGRYVEGVQGVLEFLRRPHERPWCLVVSLVNPHDISFFPDGWDQGGYRLEDFSSLPVEVPPNAADPLTTKPSVQALYAAALQARGPVGTPELMRQYGQFYAYLHGVVEPNIQRVLDALDALGLTENTVIVRTADHGELGLSHQLREKSYSAYEEMIHVPLVISNPRLFPQPRRTDALWSHADLLATLCELAGLPPQGVGKSHLPIFAGQSAVQDSIVFAFDDNFLLDEDTPASHIRALREDRWTYAVYYSPDGSLLEYELYDNASDPLQLDNLLFQKTHPEWPRLHAELFRRMQETASSPSFPWPQVPA